MKIYFLCADDKVFLPDFFEKLFTNSDYEYQGVAIVDDPKFIKFLLNSLKFMGWKLFLSEIIYQIKIRLITIIKRLFNSSSIRTIESICSKYNIECHHVDKINTKAFRNYLREKEIEILVSVACPQILKNKILAIPRKAALNIHYALLPKYRGQYPSFWVLAQGEQYTGVSVHHMEHKVDAGKILVQIEEKIRPEDTFYSLVKRLKSNIGPKAMLEALAKLAEDDDSIIDNDIDSGSYFSFPTRDDMIRFRNNGRKWR